jgi:lipopolysaccharide biosynthesis regulator YciM
MELSLLFLLLPFAAVSGWWIGSRNQTNEKASSIHDCSGDYFKGLNYLLGEQPDKAIDVFVKMLEVNSETVETHLALGNLFRRRGEVDRAIRIHQNLMARPTLSREQRAIALFELGRDYLHAGMLGRAESLFLELVAQGSHRAEALERLLDIYQQEKGWDKAIDAAQRLESVTGRRMNELVAQFYCELAEKSRVDGDDKAARNHVHEALAADRKCARASLLKADMEKAAGNCKEAIKSLRHVEQQEPAYLPEAVPPLLECYHLLGIPEEGEQYLRHLLQNYGGITPLLSLAELVRQRQGEQAAVELIVTFLRARPSVRGLDRLIELNLAASDGEARENLLILKELTKRLMEEKPAYRCRNCGFKAKVMHWQCPSCRQWGGIRSVQGVVGE